MNAAIDELEKSLEAVLNNEPIHRAAGDAEQADLDAAAATDFRQAIDLLAAPANP